MNRKNTFLLIIFLFFSIALGAGVYYFYFSGKEMETISPPTITDQEKNTMSSRCLAEDEYADYLRRGDSFVPSLPLTILIKEKKTKKEKYRFEVSDVSASEAYPLSNLMYRCGLYVVREFNFDLENLKTLLDFRNEIWRYQYDGKGEKILTLSYKDENGLDHFFYSDNFRINDTETYIALVRSWYGDANHALVIKNLKTMEDVFVLTIKELTEIYGREYEGKYAFEPGTFSFGDWRRIGNDILGFEILNDSRPSFQLDTTTWQLEMTSPPFEEYPLPSPPTINLQYLKLK